ncbi:MAG: hypothetical protein H3Z53_06050 [archaeon]|nr:hypothetical protein [archaeon]MCP8313918.1 hypothetical protein [archaeon]MCP8320595.1 hypothetical protein [archaeon]
MSKSITLKTIYKEVRNIREMLEELAEKTVINVLSEEEIGEEEWRELREAEEEIRKGEYVTLEEAEKKLKAK